MKTFGLKTIILQWLIMHHIYLGQSHILQKLVEIKTKDKTENKGENREEIKEKEKAHWLLGLSHPRGPAQLAHPLPPPCSPPASLSTARARRATAPLPRSTARARAASKGNAPHPPANPSPQSFPHRLPIVLSTSPESSHGAAPVNRVPTVFLRPRCCVMEHRRGRLRR
jgi:hypothetical protein